MRYLFLFFTLFVTIYAKEQTCYTVQLLSTSSIKQQDIDTILNQTYPKSCKILTIGKVHTVRCGCTQNFQEIKQNLKALKKTYKKAYIATTYAYRFKPKKIIIKKLSPQELELRLMFQTFLYSNDIKNAYKLSKKAYAKYNSIFWLKNIIKTAKYNSKIEEAIKYETILCNKTQDKKLQDKLIGYNITNYQYQKAEPIILKKALLNPNDKNIQMVIFIYDKLGMPLRSAEFLHKIYLKNPKKQYLLTKELSIYINTGEIEKAKKIIQLIEQNRSYDIDNTSLIAIYYFRSKNIQKAFKTLLLAKKFVKDKNLYYYKQLSDVAWYLQDYHTSYEASNKLIKLKQARLVDFNRVIQLEQNKKLSAKLQMQMYKQFKIDYLFYSYASSAMKLEKFIELQNTIKQLQKDNSPLTKQALFYIVKAQLDKHLNNHQELKSIELALKFSDNNNIVLENIFWFYMDNNYNNELKLFLQNMEEKEVPQSFYKLFAIAYYKLTNIDKANYYIQKVPQTKDIDFELLRAYIASAQNEQPRYKQILNHIYNILNTKNIFKQKKLLKTYLTVMLELKDYDKFSIALQKAKPYLKQKDYDELKYMWSIKTTSYEKSHFIKQHMNQTPLWITFNDLRLFKNHTQAENLLYTQLNNLSQGDAVMETLYDGQISLAQSITYKILYKNNKNQNAYIQHKDLVKKRSDLLDTKYIYTTQDNLTQSGVYLKNKTYISNSYTLFTELQNLKNTQTNITKKDDSFIKLALQKQFNQANIKLYLGYRKCFDDFFTYGIDATYNYTKQLNTRFSIYKNEKATISPEFLLLANKDSIQEQLTYNFLKSTSINVLLEQNTYHTQENSTIIGTSNQQQFILRHKIRTGYPDMTMSLFFNNYLYSQQNEQLLLPNNFYEIGTTFDYGMVNSEIYTRVWRPFFSVSQYYSSLADNYNLGFGFGYGGKVYSQDHLSFGMNFSTTSTSNQEVIMFYLRYQFLYQHY